MQALKDNKLKTAAELAAEEGVSVATVRRRLAKRNDLYTKKRGRTTVYGKKRTNNKSTEKATERQVWYINLLVDKIDDDPDGIVRNKLRDKYRHYVKTSPNENRAADRFIKYLKTFG